jgi:hypothetical protein
MRSTDGRIAAASDGAEGIRAGRAPIRSGALSRLTPHSATRATTSAPSLAAAILPSVERIVGEVERSLARDDRHAVLIGETDDR